MGIATLIWIPFTLVEFNDFEDWYTFRPRGVANSPYHWTAKDVALAECILNIISWPFAIHFLNNRGALAEYCTVKTLLGTDPNRFYGPLGLISFLGALSVLLLGWQIVRYVASKSEVVDTSDSLHEYTSYSPYDRYPLDRSVISDESVEVTKSDVWFGRLCVLNIILSFIGNWAVWSCK